MVTIETWHLAALCIDRAIKPDEAVPFPMDELQFEQLGQSLTSPKPYSTRSKAANSSVSLLGSMIKLNKLLDRVNKFNASLASGLTKLETSLHLVEELSSSLHSWRCSLAPQFQYSSANISYWSERDLGQAFLNLHILYHNVGQRLFFQVLFLRHDNVEASVKSTTQVFVEKCKSHAKSMCEIVYRSRERSDTELLSALVGHMLFISSTIHLHTLLFSLDDTEIVEVKLRLEKNFEVLMRLSLYWPNMSTAMSRFNAFHEACLRDGENSFRQGLWIL